MPESLNAEDTNMRLVGADIISKLYIYTLYQEPCLCALSVVSKDYV